jgi:hypothetical protein
MLSHLDAGAKASYLTRFLTKSGIISEIFPFNENLSCPKNANFRFCHPLTAS